MSNAHLPAAIRRVMWFAPAHDAEPIKCGLPAVNASDFLGGIARTHTDALAAQRAAYVKLLQRHDWSYEFADDASVYRKGRDELAELQMVQREIDADYSIWNAHAPDGYKRRPA